MADPTIANAVTILGITKAEAKTLDTIDGKQDDSINYSIFDEAREVLESMRKPCIGKDISNIVESPVFRALEGTINKILGAMDFEIQYYKKGDSTLVSEPGNPSLVEKSGQLEKCTKEDFENRVGGDYSVVLVKKGREPR